MGSLHFSKVAMCIFALAAAQTAPAAAPPRTHQAQTPAELDDEMRVIGTVAAYQRFHDRRATCVSRRIDASNFTALPTTDLAAAEHYFETRAGLPLDPAATPRRLHNEAIRATIAGAGLDESCSGYVFLTFHRIQFLGDVAIALVGVGERAPWRDSLVLYRLRRGPNAWSVRERRLIDEASGFVDGPNEIDMQRGFFAIGR